jgi:hypothetical protein
MGSGAYGPSGVQGQSPWPCLAARKKRGATRAAPRSCIGELIQMIDELGANSQEGI